MRKQKFLVVDTETGGLSCDEHSLLSFAGIAWTPGEEPTPVFDIYVKEDDINTIPKALEVNKIDLNEVKEKQEEIELTSNQSTIDILEEDIYNTKQSIKELKKYD